MKVSISDLNPPKNWESEGSGTFMSYAKDPSKIEVHFLYKDGKRIVQTYQIKLTKVSEEES